MLTRSVLLAIALLLAVAAGSPADVRLVDVETGSVRVLVPRDEHFALRWSDDGASVLVREERGAVLRVAVAVADGRAIEERALRDAVAIGPGGRTLVQSDEGYVLKAPDGRVVRRIDANPWLDDLDLAWSRDGSRVAMTTEGLIEVLDANTGRTLVRRRTDLENVSPQAFTADGRALYATNDFKAARIEVPSGATRTVLKWSSDEFFPSAVVSPADRLAIALDGRLVVPGLLDVRLPVSGIGPIRWSPAGEQLAARIEQEVDACSEPVTGLALVTPGQPPRTLIAPGNRAVGGVVWSPDAKTLAVSLGPDFVAEAEKRGSRKPWPKQISREYEMFSRRGDQAVRQIVLRFARALRRGAGREEALRQIRLDHLRVAERFGEANDTAVGEAIGDEVDKWLRAAGFEGTGARDEYTCLPDD